MPKLKSKRGPGRPEVNIDDKLDQIEGLAGIGLTNAHIADYFGIKEVTLYRKINANPEIGEAIRRGKARAIAKVSSVALKLATGDEEKKIPVNPQVLMFWLRSRAREAWSDNISVEHTGRIDHSHTMTARIAAMDEPELRKRIAQLRSGDDDDEDLTIDI